MAEALWLMTNTTVKKENQRLINGITGCVINADDGQTTAATSAEAAGRLRSAGHAVPDDYFDTGVIISDLTAGALKDDMDLYVFGNLPTQKVEGP